MNMNKGVQRAGLVITGMTLLILSCQGVGGFNPFATETPTPTATFTPSPTVTPSPAATSTLTPTPTSTPLPAGINIEEQPDGSTLFIDYDNGYQLVLPEEWLAIPFEKDDLTAVVDKLAVDNPNLVDSAEAFKDMDPDIFRLVALNTDPEAFVNGFATNLNITAIEDALLSSMPLAFITGALEESFEQDGAKVLTQGVNTIDNAQGIDIEFIDIEQSVSGDAVLQRIIAFQVDKKLILITITAPKQLGSDIFLSGNRIASSIEILE